VKIYSSLTADRKQQEVYEKDAKEGPKIFLTFLILKPSAKICLALKLPL